MRNIATLLLVATLGMAGCAKNVAMDQTPAPEPAPPVVAERTPPAPVIEPAPVVVEKAPEPAPVPAPEPKVAVEPAAMRIFFEFDSALLTPESQEVLRANSLWLQAQPEVRIRIEGHTDERGSSSYNLALGERRAQAARDYLLNLGIAPARVSVISYGEEKAEAGKDETAWAKDRRAELVKAN